MTTLGPVGAPDVPAPLAYAPVQDPAWGLDYATQVLEADGFMEGLSPTEAPRLSQAAGGQFVSHAILKAQIDDAARVVATDPASAGVVDRVRQTQNALLQPQKEPIPNSVLQGVMTGAGIAGMVLGILPFLGFVFSPWLIIGVLAVSLGAYLLQLWNQHAVGSATEQAKREHEEAILALLRRADEVRAQLAARARATAQVSIEPPAQPQ